MFALFVVKNYPLTAKNAENAKFFEEDSSVSSDLDLCDLLRSLWLKIIL
jgi:hypothetical protein